VFYKSASNDVIRAFDMVHARLPLNEPVELWLGESKLAVTYPVRLPTGRLLPGMPITVQNAPNP
jgi:hypothetical protein